MVFIPKCSLSRIPRAYLAYLPGLFILKGQHSNISSALYLFWNFWQNLKSLNQCFLWGLMKSCPELEDLNTWIRNPRVFKLWNFKPQPQQISTTKAMHNSDFSLLLSSWPIIPVSRSLNIVHRQKARSHETQTVCFSTPEYFRCAPVHYHILGKLLFHILCLSDSKSHLRGTELYPQESVIDIYTIRIFKLE